jgi:Na+/melibiose symporter-like transporter
MGDQGRPLGIGQIAAFAAPGIPISALGLPLVVYLPPFFAELGIELAAVGTIFMIARFWDVVTDPVIGIASDKFGTRFGRRRPWIAMSVPILMWCVYKVFMPPDVVNAAYLLWWMLLLYVGWTMLTISHMAWGAELTDRYHERSRIQGWREFAVGFGMFGVLLLPAVIERTGGDTRARVASMGWFIIIFLPIAVALALWRVPERKVPDQPAIGWRRAAALVFRNAFMRRVLLADVLIGLGFGVVTALYLFFVGHVLLLPKHGSSLLLVYLVAGILGIPMWMRLSYRFGKHRTLAVGMLYSCVTLSLALLWQPGDFWPFMASNVLFGAGYGAAPVLLRSITADITDADNLESGSQRTGLFYALLAMTNKVGYALSVGITYPLLSFIGFDPKLENTHQATERLRWMFVGLPVLALGAASYAMWRFPLDEERQAELRRMLEARSAGRPVKID